MASRLVPLNDSTFDAWTANEIELTVVCVGAEWCDSTKKLAPVLDDLSADYRDRVRFAMVDFDRSPEFVKKHNITGVPIVMLFKQNSGCEQDIIACGVGAHREAIEDAIRRFV